MSEVKIMNELQPPPDIDVEPTFDSFVKWFGGELVRDALPANTDVPLNADYFLRGRSIVAELKCLEKDYLSKPEIEQKIQALFLKWGREGKLRPEHIGPGNRVHINSLGEDCAMEVFKLYFQPLQKAVKQANRQIRQTKEYFDLPSAKGLVILAIDGNYALTPEMSACILARLLPYHYSSIDSFIYFTPNMMVPSKLHNRLTNVWISGASPHPSANPVEDEYLNQITRGWIQYLEQTTGEPVTVFDRHGGDDDWIRDLPFVRSAST